MKKALIIGSFVAVSVIAAIGYHYYSEGRCTGSKGCRACSSCNYCKHCAKEGGSCGVCKH